jgi:hypothetical protein
MYDHDHELVFASHKFPRLVFSSFGINFRPRTSLKVKERWWRKRKDDKGWQMADAVTKINETREPQNEMS